MFRCLAPFAIPSFTALIRAAGRYLDQADSSGRQNRVHISADLCATKRAFQVVLSYPPFGRFKRDIPEHRI